LKAILFFGDEQICCKEKRYKLNFAGLKAKQGNFVLSFKSWRHWHESWKA
jgi:hypothetical protein